MKYRVVEKIYKDGSSKFFPQRKFFLFWHYFHEWGWEDCIRVSRSSLGSAEECIKAEIKLVENNTRVSKRVHSYVYPNKKEHYD